MNGRRAARLFVTLVAFLFAAVVAYVVFFTGGTF